MSINMELRKHCRLLWKCLGLVPDIQHFQIKWRFWLQSEKPWETIEKICVFWICVSCGIRRVTVYYETTKYNAESPVDKKNLMTMHYPMFQNQQRLCDVLMPHPAYSPNPVSIDYYFDRYNTDFPNKTLQFLRYHFPIVWETVIDNDGLYFGY